MLPKDLLFLLIINRLYYVRADGITGRRGVVNTIERQNKKTEKQKQQAIGR